ncbi:MAG TPA: hypothetical protein DCM49_00720 [Lachnospiraceae bacterium]|nr:hypothetical protein [Lachnospiraceae bacterium]
MDKKKTKAWSNMIGAIVFIIFSIWAWIQTYDFKVVTGTVVQPSVFPRVMIIGMLIFSVVLLIQSLVKLKTMKPEDELAQPTESINPMKKDVRTAYIVILLSIMFVVLFQPLGYVLDAFIICFIIMFLIGKRNWLQMILVSLLVPFGMYLIFHKVLTVVIPMGPLQFLADLIDSL